VLYRRRTFSRGNVLLPSARGSLCSQGGVFSAWDPRKKRILIYILSKENAKGVFNHNSSLFTIHSSLFTQRKKTTARAFSYEIEFSLYYYISKGFFKKTGL
jgi:hypothetical protein